MLWNCHSTKGFSYLKTKLAKDRAANSSENFHNQLLLGRNAFISKLGEKERRFMYTRIWGYRIVQDVALKRRRTPKKGSPKRQTKQ